jgi:hypothetical protein
MDEEVTRGRISLSGLVQSAREDLTVAKKAYLSRIDDIDSWIKALDAGKPYWDNVDENALASTYSGGSAIDFLGAMAKQAQSIRSEAERSNKGQISFNSTATVYGAITLNANVSIFHVDEFDPHPLKTIVNNPGRDTEYARKFEVFDPELGRLIRQIHQTFSRTTSHPAKSTIPGARQAYDHLIRRLVPDDDDVRAQTWWNSNPKDKENPNRVTRRHRYRHAAEKHIKDVSERETLLAGVDHALKVYEDLNKLLHTEKPVDNKAQATAKAMLEVLYQWADALGL